MSSRVNKSRTTSGDIKPNFYAKVKRSCQKVSLEKPENLKRKFYQRKEDGINLEEENINKNAHSYYADTPGRKSKSHPDPNKYSWSKVQDPVKGKTTQCFPEEIRVLEDKQRLPSKGESLKIAPKRDGGLLRSNTRLSY